MRVLIQRVLKAGITIEQKLHAVIQEGLLVLLGIEDADDLADIEWLSGKIVNLRIFNDANGIMNISAKEKSADVLLISQFTLFASCKKGNRPSYIRSAKREIALPLYIQMIMQLEKDLGSTISTGIFGADMKVELVNDGPVTIFIDSKNKE